MPLSLEAALRLQPEPVRRFLDAAVSADALTTGMLVAAGVPHYEATLYCRHLHAAGELVDGGWTEPARVGYRALLASPAEPPRRLDRLHEGERPREKALHSGIRSLSDTELLALLLRTGGGDEGVLEFAIACWLTTTDCWV